MSRARKHAPIWLAAITAMATGSIAATRDGTRPPPWAMTNALRTVVEASTARFGFDGDANLTVSEAAVLVARRWSDAFESGVALRYTRLDPEGDTDAPAIAPWSPVHEVGLAVPLSLALAGGRARLAPTARWSAEEGADWSEAATVGMVLSQGWQLEAGHELGFGAVVSHGLGRTRVIPFPLVWWNLSDRWQIGNSAPLGPATPAGIEARWRPATRWTLGAGFSYRNDRYLRADDEHVAEWRSVPIWLRGTYRYGPFGVTLWGGVAVARRIDLRDTDGRRLDSIEPSTAPLLGFSLTARF